MIEENIVKTRSKKKEDKKFPEEVRLDDSLRPSRLDDLIGRRTEKKILRTLIESAEKRNTTIDHLLLYGPPGLGKTTIARIVAKELGADFRCTSGPVLERAGDLAALLTGLTDKSVLFIDEIHRIRKNVEEILYSAMEDFTLDIIVGKGPAAKSIRIDLPRFTLIGATTRVGLLGAPLRDRFGHIQRLDYYSDEDLAVLIDRNAKLLDLELDTEAMKQIAMRSRGTARVANRMVKRIRDYAVSKNIKKMSADNVVLILSELGVDENGLDDIDRRVLVTIAEKYDGGPVGIRAISATIAEDPGTIEDMVEPFLLQKGFLIRGPRGRSITKEGLAAMKISL